MRTLQVESSTSVRFCQVLFAGGKRAAGAALSSPATPDTGAVKGGPCGPTCSALDGPRGRCYASPVRRPQWARSRYLERGRTPEASVSGPEGAAPEAPRAGRPPWGRDDRGRRTRTTTAWGREGGRAGDSEPPARPPQGPGAAQGRAHRRRTTTHRQGGGHRYSYGAPKRRPRGWLRARGPVRST